jgi:hypothetical protein
MTTANDMTTLFKEFLGSLPVDSKSFEDTIKNTAALNEKFANVAMEAAEKSTEISSKWAKDTIARVSAMAKSTSDPVDYIPYKAMSDFASAQAEMATENVVSFAEVAKKVQMETVELVMAVGKDLNKEDASK